MFIFAYKVYNLNHKVLNTFAFKSIGKNTDQLDCIPKGIIAKLIYVKIILIRFELHVSLKHNFIWYRPSYWL